MLICGLNGEIINRSVNKIPIRELDSYPRDKKSRITSTIAKRSYFIHLKPTIDIPTYITMNLSMKVVGIIAKWLNLDCNHVPVDHRRKMLRKSLQLELPKCWKYQIEHSMRFYLSYFCFRHHFFCTSDIVPAVPLLHPDFVHVVWFLHLGLRGCKPISASTVAPVPVPTPTTLQDTKMSISTSYELEIPFELIFLKYWLCSAISTFQNDKLIQISSNHFGNRDTYPRKPQILYWCYGKG